MMPWLAALLTGTSLLAPVLTGAPEAWLATMVWLPTVLGHLTRPWSQRLPWRHALAVMTVGSIAALFVGMAADAVVGHVLIALLLYQRCGPEEDHSTALSLLLGLLLLIGAVARSQGVWFLPLWVCWMVAAPLVLWSPGPRRHAALRQRLQTILLLTTIVVTTAVFLVLPRPQGPAAGVHLHEDVSVTGISDEVELGAFEMLVDDNREVGFVTWLGEAPPDTRLRASALDYFDGRAWRNTVPMRASPRLAAGGPRYTVAVEHAPIGGTVMVPGVVGAWLDMPPVRQDVSDAWRTEADVSVRYTAEVVVDGLSFVERLLPHEQARYLQLPDGLDARLASLAARVATADLADDRLQQVVAYVQGEHRYERRVAHSASDPLASFFFEDRRGHCEYFAAGTATLLRLSGIPARVVIGFVHGESRGQGVVFRASDAHAWVEAFLPGRGWVSVDATAASTMSSVDSSWAPPPPAAPVEPTRPWGLQLEAWWSERVVGYGRAQQQALLQAVTLGRPGRVITMCLAVALALWISWRGRPMWQGRAMVPRAGQALDKADGAIAAIWRDAMASLASAHIIAPAGLPPLEAARWFARQHREQGDALVRLVWLHYEVTYGGASAEDRVVEARELLAAIQTWASERKE